MKQTFLVNGLSCLVEGNRATVYIPRENNSCADKSDGCGCCGTAEPNDMEAKAKRVGRYLVSEGFVDGKQPIGICYVQSTKS
jgi:hypothetical protein